MSKYEPMESYLAAQSESPVTLTFAQMEEILGFKLPPSAYNHRAWWSNGKKGGSKFWLKVGWEVDAIKEREWVRFRKAISRFRAEVGEGEGEEFADVVFSLDMAEIPGLIKDCMS